MNTHISPFRIKVKKNIEERGLKFPVPQHLFREPPVNITQEWDISPPRPPIALHITNVADHMTLIPL
jgi:hypothetical protein